MKHFFLSKTAIVFYIAVVFYCGYVEYARRAKEGGLDNFSQRIESLRTHGIKNKISEAKKVGTKPDWVRKEIGELSDDIVEYMRGENSLTDGQVRLAIETLGFSGKDALSASSLIMDVVLKKTDSPVVVSGLLALARINPDSSSLHDFLENMQKQSSGNYQGYVDAFVARYNNCQALKTSLDDELRKVDLTKGHQKDAVDFFVLSPQLQELFVKSSIYGCLSLETKNFLLSHMTNNASSELLISLIDILGDQKQDAMPEYQEKFTERLSEIMQYGSALAVRERAFMALRRMASEQSLNAIRSYGHKMIDGEAKKIEMPENPFISWAKLQHKQKKL